MCKNSSTPTCIHGRTRCKNSPNPTGARGRTRCNSDESDLALKSSELLPNASVQFSALPFPNYMEASQELMTVLVWFSTLSSEEFMKTPA